MKRGEPAFAGGKGSQLRFFRIANFRGNLGKGGGTLEVTGLLCNLTAEGSGFIRSGIEHGSASAGKLSIPA